MYLVLEYIEPEYASIMLSDNGDALFFDSIEEAELFASDNCSFSFKVVELWYY